MLFKKLETPSNFNTPNQNQKNKRTTTPEFTVETTGSKYLDPSINVYNPRSLQVYVFQNKMCFFKTNKIVVCISKKLFVFLSCISLNVF